MNVEQLLLAQAESCLQDFSRTSIDFGESSQCGLTTERQIDFLIQLVNKDCHKLSLNKFNVPYPFY